MRCCLRNKTIPVSKTKQKMCSTLGCLHSCSISTCTSIRGQRGERKEGDKGGWGSPWFSIKHIYFTFIEYTRTESTRIQHGALRWGSVGTREERGDWVKRNTTALQLVGKVLFEKKNIYIFRVMLLMQSQASLGMCLQDSKTETGPGTSCTFTWNRSIESKSQENKGAWNTEWEKAQGSTSLPCSFS